MDTRRIKHRSSLLLAGAALGTGAWVAALAQGGEHASDATHFLLAFAAVVVAAKIGGEIFEWIGQPAVMGELVIGIVLGNLAWTGLGVSDTLSEAPFLAIAAEIGVVLLLFQVGLESDLDELLAVGPSALCVAVLGVIAPVTLGYAVSSIFMPEDVEWYVHLFVGATLAATSVGITARVLQDIGKTAAPESRIILGAAVVDDILGLVLLAFVTGLIGSADASGETGFSLLPLLLILLKALGFLVGTFLLSRKIIQPAIVVIERAKSKSAPVVLSVAYCFVMAALAELVGLANIVGAFAAGLVVEDSIVRHFGTRTNRYKIDRSVTPIAALFVPVFFVDMGLRVDLASFAFTEVLVFAGVLSLVAMVSKQVCSLGVTQKGVNRWAVGVGMIPRGEVGLIFARVGATVMVTGVPVFSQETFSAIVAAVMLTTLLTPPLLKAAFSRQAEERDAPQASLFNGRSEEAPVPQGASQRPPRT